MAVVRMVVVVDRHIAVVESVIVAESVRSPCDDRVEPVGCDVCGHPGMYKIDVLIWWSLICGVIWTQMSAWRWGTRVWEVDGE